MRTIARSADERRVAPVGEIMTKMVVVAAPDETLISVARKLREHRVSGLPVVDETRRVVGVVSERDLARELHRAAGLMTYRGVLDLVLAYDGSEEIDRVRQSVERLHSVRVRDVMAKKPVTVDVAETVQECLRIIGQYGINRLPVVTDGRLTGIVTRSDLLAAMAPTS